MKRRYNKPALTFEQQIERLMGRGLQVDNKQAAAKSLSSINYYRLSAYWYPFRERDSNEKTLDQFMPEASFKQVLELYEFDRKLRLLVLDAIERIEVAIRTQLTYYLSHRYKAFGHVNPQNFHPQFDHKNWLLQIKEETERASEEFVRHYKNKYEGFPELPLWILTELMSLGKLSRLYRGLKPEDKKEISKHFQVHYKRFGNWLHILTYIRNVCAHHSRLWNRELDIKPSDTKQKEWLPPITPRHDRIFYVLLILRHLLKITGNGVEWTKQINALLEPLTLQTKWRAAMGIPENWKQHPIWSMP